MLGTEKMKEAGYMSGVIDQLQQKQTNSTLLIYAAIERWISMVDQLNFAG